MASKGGEKQATNDLFCFGLLVWFGLGFFPILFLPLTTRILFRERYRNR